MSLGEIVQFAGAMVGLLVVLNEIIKHIKEWRKGSPELRLLRDHIDFHNKNVFSVISSFADRVNSIARKMGV